MDVSIIIPSLDSPTIDRTLAAVRAQAGSTLSWEVIGVGLDRPGRVRPFPGLTWIDTGRPRPPAPARNLGAERAAGDWLLFLDADCEPAPDWLAAFEAAFREPENQVLGGGVAFDDGPYWTLADNIATFYPYLASAPAGEREQLPSLNLAIRREAWLAVGPFDERYPYPAAEDSDWSARARGRGIRLRFHPAARVFHRPARATAGDLWRHHRRFGASSIKVDARHDPPGGRPLVLRHAALLALAAPFLAAAVTARCFLGNRALWRHWPTAPAVYLAKLGWCAGALSTLRHGAPWAAGPPG
jgi:GT2 family glycosyltransferase